ncbi:bacterial Ig-like domain (group 1) [Peptococcaceae bacterium CEB3]|nr:bacterial Ig-like domain (group 1) [Peptococcaceae bacterium CEB3]
MFKDDRGGIDPYIALIISITVLMVGLIFGVEALIVPRTQTTLQTAAEMLVKSESINGCITTGTQKAVENYLLDNQLDPKKVFFSPPPSSQSAYGTDMGSTSQPAITLGYDLNVFALSPSKTDPLYVQAQAPINKSSYTPNSANNSADCANSGLFTGVPGGSDSGNSPGAGNISTPTAGSISAQVPSTATQGVVTMISGQTDLPGAQVSIFGAGFSSTTTADGNGNFSFPAVFTLAGPNQVLTLSSGSASQVYSITVNPDPVGSIQFTSPNPNAVQIGQPFVIAGTARDTNGNPLPDGTRLSFTSNDQTDIPTQTVPVLNGQFSLTLPSGITQNVASVLVSETDTSPATTYSITATPGQPKSITVSASPTTVKVGNPVNLTGFVASYGGMAVQDGTPVTISLNDNTLGTATTTGGHYSFTVPGADLTQAGPNNLYVSTGNNISASATVLVNPGIPAQISGLSGVPNPVSPGSNTAITGVVEDQYGNPVNQAYSISVNGASETCDTHGVLSFSWSFPNPGMQTLDFTYGGAVIGALTINVNTTVNGLRLTPVQSIYTIIAGQSVTGIQFKMTDSNGNPVKGDTVSFEGQNGTTASNGLAGPFNTPVLTTAGSQTLTATVPSIPGSEGTVGVVVNPAAAYQLQGATVSPNPVIAGFKASVNGIVADQYGNPVSGDSIVVSGGYGAPSSPSVSGQNGIPGYVSVPITGTNVGGPYPLAVKDSTTRVALVSSLSLTVKAPSGATLSLSPVNGTAIADVNTGFQIKASVTDNTGAAIPDVSVSFSVSPDTSAGLNPIPGITDSSGNVIETATFNQTGNQVITAAATVDGQNLSTSIDLYATTPIMGSISWGTVGPNPVVAGNGLTVAGQALDITGNPIRNTQIQIYFKEGGAGVQTLNTDANGYFWTTLTPTVTGQITLMAQIGNVVIQYPTPITVNPGPPVSGTISFNYTPPLLTNDTFTVVVHLQDASGNSVPNVPVTINASSPTKAFYNPSTWHPDTCSDGSPVLWNYYGYYCNWPATLIPGYYTYQYPETVNTDANGNATVTMQTSQDNSKYGTINVTATAGSLNLTKSIYADVQSPVSYNVTGFTDTISQQSAYISILDQKGRPINNVPVHVACTWVGGSVFNPYDNIGFNNTSVNILSPTWQTLWYSAAGQGNQYSPVDTTFSGTQFVSFASLSPSKYQASQYYCHMEGAACTITYKIKITVNAVSITLDF